jgi:hypothetical protein
VDVYFLFRTRFKNPPPQYNLKEAFKNTTRPPYWTFEVYEMPSSGDGYGNVNNNNKKISVASDNLFPLKGYENEDFIVWMRTAAVSNFKKLYRRVQGPLEAGSYVLEVNYSNTISMCSLVANPVLYFFCLFIIQGTLS